LLRRRHATRIALLAVALQVFAPLAAAIEVQRSAPPPDVCVTRDGAPQHGDDAAACRLHCLLSQCGAQRDAAGPPVRATLPPSAGPAWTVPAGKGVPACSIHAPSAGLARAPPAFS
jgi:hypothetical protein